MSIQGVSNSNRLNYLFIGIIGVLILTNIFTLFKLYEAGLEQKPVIAPPVAEPAEKCSKLYLDSDGDGYGIPESTGELCPGEDLPLGFATRDGDCDDSNSTVWNSLTVYEDHDLDGVSSNISKEVCTNKLPPKGYKAIMSDPLDCDDRNVIVYPGADRVETASSPDYNCDGKQELSIGTIFVTKNKYYGNIGGLNGADAICQKSAEDVDFVGKWIAVLSTSEVDAIDRLPSTSFVDALSKIIAENTTVFAGNYIESKIQYTQFGELTYENVWTGSNEQGEFPDELSVSSATCDDWTSRSSIGIVGSSRSTSNSRWFKEEDVTCSKSSALYCVRVS